MDTPSAWLKVDMKVTRLVDYLDSRLVHLKVEYLAELLASWKGNWKVALKGNLQADLKESM